MADEVEVVTTQTPAVQTPAEAASSAAVEAHITGASPEKATPLFDKAAALHRREAAVQASDGSWRDGSEVSPLSPMPDAPKIAPSEVTSAIARLNERSYGHSDLVARWGDDFAPNFAYAKAAYKDIVTNHPDLIEKFEASGLADDPSVIEHLAQFGRQNAGRLGDFTIARNHNNNGPVTMPTFIPSSPTRAGPSDNSNNNNGALETQGELNRLLAANPPGSQGYKTNAPRIAQLYRTLAGSGSPVGRGGRRT